MTILSLGAGVQSSTLALMAAVGEIEAPDHAIFADTGWEPAAVYKWLDWLTPRLPYPVHRVSVGNIREDQIGGHNTTGQRFAAIPWFTAKGGMGRRQCTREYKVAPITAKIRQMGGGPKSPVDLWVGISLDETGRMKPNRTKWIRNVWPLIDRRMNRRDCIEWMADHGYPKPPRSSCIGCPFHSDSRWRHLRDTSSAEWADAVEVDKTIRVQKGFREEQYMHRSLQPLDQVDLDTDYDRGQLDLWLGECEGMCGV